MKGAGGGGPHIGGGVAVLRHAARWRPHEQSANVLTSSGSFSVSSSSGALQLLRAGSLFIVQYLWSETGA